MSRAFWWHRSFTVFLGLAFGSWAIAYVTYPYGSALAALYLLVDHIYAKERKARWLLALRARLGSFDEDVRSCAGCRKIIWDDFEHDVCDTPADRANEDRILAEYRAEGLVIPLDEAFLFLAARGGERRHALEAFVRARQAAGDPGPLYVQGGEATTDQYEQEQRANQHEREPSNANREQQ